MDSPSCIGDSVNTINYNSLPKDTVLITGGAGFIGSHTADYLLSLGFKVRVLDNLSSGNRDNLPLDNSQIELIIGDIRDENIVLRSMQGIRHVLHLAAQVSVDKSVHNPVNSCQQNIVGFLTVLDAAKRVGARIVYASSAAVYGEPLTLPLTESSPTNPISPYGLEKLTNEAYAALYSRLYETSSLGLRFFNVYGSRQDPSSPYSGVITKFIQMIRANKPLTIRGDGQQKRDFIHVSDVAHANVAALFSDLSGVVNVASGQCISILALTDALARALRTTFDLQYVPAIPGDIQVSAADNSRLQESLYSPKIHLVDGLQEVEGT